MKPIRLIAIAAMASFLSVAQAAEGLITLKSPHGAGATMDKLEMMAEERGLKVFARIDHAAGAAKVDSALRPTEVLIFGNPKGGTPLMECSQTVGIDLPLKALVWEDAEGQVWLGYNDPRFLAERHNAEDCPAFGKVAEALKGLTERVVAH